MNNDTHNEAKSIADGLKDKSLETAGYAYLVADAALIAAALCRKEPEKGVAIGAALWGIGSLAAVGFGHKPAERHLNDLSNALRDDFEKNGVLIPSDSSISRDVLAAKGGLVDKTQDFLYRNPSQALNAIYGLGGVVGAYSATDTPIRMSNSLVAAGGLLGILLAEKDPDRERKESEVSATTPISWFTDKPLRISSAAYIANNFFTVQSAMKQTETIPKYGRYVAAASYMLANTMFALSSKDHNKQSAVPDDVLKTIETEAATIIATLPKQAQEAMLHHVAQEISEQEGVNVPSEDIFKAMTQRIQSVGTPSTMVADASMTGKTPLAAEQPQKL